MRNIIKTILFAFAVMFSLISCENREVIIVDKESAPIILDLSKDALVLDQHFPNNPALTLTWEPAKYTVPTEINYRIEASKTQDFTKPFVLGSFNQSVTSASFNVAQMNEAAGGLALETGMANPVYLRVVSYLGSPQYLQNTSNVTKLMLTPYEVVYPDFYLVGAASSIGWDAAKALKFTKNKELSTLTTTLKEGETFRFLGQNDWNPLNYSIDQAGTREKYRYFKQVTSNVVFADEENMKFTGKTGTYKITINAKEQSLTIVAQ